MSDPSSPTVEEIMEAQADLQTALGFYRHYHGQKDGVTDTVEDRLAKALSRLHTLLDNLGHPMYDPATHPEVPAGPTPVMLMDDLIVDRYNVLGGEAFHVRVTHKPSGIVASGVARDTRQAASRAMEKLRSKLQLRDASHTPEVDKSAPTP